MVKTYNKLVRDRIPEIIQNNGQICRTKQLTDEEYIAALDAKLYEEYSEYQESRSIKNWLISLKYFALTGYRSV
jgi:predicted house-cleaning noncanonical NTP pyrophosphatase (MazG superfamily)